MSEASVRGDLEWGTTPRLVADSARRFGTEEAVVDGDMTLTFATLETAVRDATRAFLAIGIEPGDRVAIWAPNCWEWIVAALGLQSAGGVLVPLNTRFKGREAAYILGRTHARALITTRDFLDTDYVALLRDAVDVEQELPDLETIVVVRGDAPEGTIGWQQFLAGGSVIEPETAVARAAAVEPTDLSDILFTSGTTGNPKGVMSTHAQTLRAYRDWSEVIGLRAGDRYLVVNPFFHGFGYKAGWLAGLMMGATILPQPVFDVPEVFARIPRDAITVLPGPPTLYQSILNHPDFGRADLSSLRLAVTGAAVIPVELIRRMRDELTFETIITGYGLTEATAIATMCRYDDDPETIATTSGRAIPGVEVRVVDEEGAEVPAGAPGEVVVRGYNVMQGYLDDPDATAEAIDADGWLHTGDIGVMDERSYLRITDRLKDMFIVGGFNAYPAEIENALLRNENVALVAVVGVPDDRMGEVGMAFVVPRPGASASAAEIIEWCRGEMANYKVPRFVEIVDELPLNATGKVLKYELREQGTKRVRDSATVTLTPEEQASRREAMQELMTSTRYMSSLGLVVEKWDEDSVRMRLPFNERLTNDGAIHHGGVVASLMDSVGAGAVWAGHDFDRGTRAATISMTVNYTGAAPGSDLIGEAQCVRRGKDLSFSEIRITDPNGKLVATGSLVYRIVP